MKIPSRGTWLALALALLIVGFSIPLLAGDKTAPLSSNGTAVVPKSPALQESAPAAGGSASLRISGAAFRPRNSSVGFAHYFSGYMYATSNPYEWWTAPVFLPQGAVVTSVRLFYYDSNASVDCGAFFTVYKFSDQSIFHEWYVASSGSSGLGYADTAAINHAIDYTQYAYIMHWHPNVADNTQQLGGVEIFYTPPSGQNKVTVIPLN